MIDDATTTTASVPEEKPKTRRYFNYFFSYFFDKGDASAGIGNACYALDAHIVTYSHILQLQKKIAQDTKAKQLTVIWYHLMCIEDVPEGEMSSIRALHADSLAAQLFGGKK